MTTLRAALHQFCGLDPLETLLCEHSLAEVYAAVIDDERTTVLPPEGGAQRRCSTVPTT